MIESDGDPTKLGSNNRVGEELLQLDMVRIRSSLFFY